MTGCVQRMCLHTTTTAALVANFGTPLKTHMVRSDIHWLKVGGGEEGRKKRWEDEEVVEEEWKRECGRVF